MTKIIESYEGYKNLSTQDMPDEIWKDIIGFEGFYQVSNMGRIKSLAKIIKHSNPKLQCNRKERILRQTKTNGYLNVSLCKYGIVSQHTSHRLVGLHHVDNPENKPCINHKKGIRHDNRATEIEWATHSENQKHAYDIGLHTKMIGENVNGVKLTEEDVVKIRTLLSNGHTQKKIGLTFGVNSSTISDIKTKTTWIHI